ncbi:hypothetical protein Trydic_g1012 [Trypoxylus dichotomus]
MPIKMIVKNGPSTITLSPVYADSKRPAIVGGPLRFSYEFEQVHFHWGKTDDVGSEHTIDGQHYPLEMHAVHIKENHTLEEALEDPDGIAVIAYMANQTERKNEAIRHLDEVQTNIANTKSDGTYELPTPFPINEVLVPFDRDYYYYDGSLTTSPYTENVTWIIAPSNINITKLQITNFRKFRESNCRQTQELNARS